MADIAHVDEQLGFDLYELRPCTPWKIKDEVRVIYAVESAD
jgi:hypothetical protein